jgi:membrane protease YdiL (CAAX protease family)
VVLAGTALAARAATALAVLVLTVLAVLAPPGREALRAAAPAAPSRAVDPLSKQAPAVRQPDLLAILPARLFRAEQPAIYVLLAWGFTIAGSLLLSALVSKVAAEHGPKFPEMTPATTLFLLVVFAPVVETLIMGGVLLVLNRLFGFLPAVLLSAIGWGVAHSLQAPAWGLVIWWPFLIFSLSFLVWKQRSLALAFAIPALIHAMQNLGPALLLVSGYA